MTKYRVQRFFRNLTFGPGGFAAVLPMEVRNHIDAGLQFLFKAFRKVADRLVVIDEAAAAADVRHNGATEAPFRPQDVFQQMAVDLGLPSGLLWATCNVGAENPEDYGDYYAWGETETYYEPGYAQVKEDVIWKPGKSAGYDWSSYRYCDDGKHDRLTKYCTNSNLGFSGFTDNKTVLDPDDDAAHVRWGGGWRMPTVEELDELNNPDYCTWTWTTLNGVNGYSVTSKMSGYTDRSIFLPAAGNRSGTNLYDCGDSGDYGASSLHTSWSSSAKDFVFGSDYHRTSWNGRCNGHSVRPVYQ